MSQMSNGEMILIIVYTLLCLFIGQWNSNKGNNFWIGFALSFVFTPFIGFLAVLFFRRNDRGLMENKLKSGEMKKCPQCAEIVQIEAKKCRYCGYDFPA